MVLSTRNEKQLTLRTMQGTHLDDREALHCKRVVGHLVLNNLKAEVVLTGSGQKRKQVRTDMVGKMDPVWMADFRYYHKHPFIPT